jgi:hypothetical protein
MTAVWLKEWRRLLRAPSTPWALMGYVLVPTLVAAAYLSVDQAGPPGLVAQMVPLKGARALANVGVWQVLLLCLLGARVGSGLVAAEVEQRTLEPLLAAGGRLPGVLAGKLGAAVCFVWMLVLAGLPVFALPLSAGSLPWALLGRVVVIELAWSASMVGLGLAVSAFARRTGGAALTGVILALGLTVGTALVGGLLPGVATQNALLERTAWLQRMGLPPGALLQGLSLGVIRANPLMGVSSALGSPGAQSLFGLPAAEAGLWLKQVTGLGPVVILGWLVAWLTLAVRLRWRRPAWSWTRKRKAVAMHEST